ncbi:MAG: hypothetical protein J6P57_08020 [Lachnospiraceae bacterium]|nr:hypothetical protein [Lachnospiraceae bacterium]
MDNIIDRLLKKSLEADYKPDERLDEELLYYFQNDKRKNEDDKKVNIRMHKLKKDAKRAAYIRMVQSAAAAILVFIILGSGTAYAVNAIMEKARVTEHGMSVGNEEYLSDEDLAEPLDDVNVDVIGEEEPGPDDKWISKRTEVVSGTYQNVYYTYQDYTTMVEDTPFESVFKEIPGEESSSEYVITDLDEVTREYSMGTIFNVGDGEVYLNLDYIEGNVAEDAAFGISLGSTSNEREYVTDSGINFTLADSVKDTGEGEEAVTTTLISYKKYRGSIQFIGLDEEEIYNVLENIDFSKLED